MLSQLVFDITTYFLS